MRFPPWLSVLLVVAHGAAGFGGVFGRKAPDRQVSSSGDAMVFSVMNHDQVQLQVQLDYERAVEGEVFGWILPVPAVPTRLAVGSSLLLNALFHETRPTFQLNILNTTTTTTGWGETCPASVLQDQNCSFQGPTRMDGGGGGEEEVTLWAQGHAGLLDFSVLQGTKPAVMEWLETNDWFAGGLPNLGTLLDYYDSSGTVYVVLKVHPTQVSGALQPLLIEYRLPETRQVHKVPTLLSTADPRTLQIYFLTNLIHSRAVPVNYLDVQLDDAHVDWVGCLAAPGGAQACYYQDYKKRFRNAVSSVANQTLITEYFGPSTLLLGKIAIDIAPASLEFAPNWLEFLLLLEDARVPPISGVQGILDAYIPPKSFLALPPFQCAQMEHVYQPFLTTGPSMSDCFQIFNPPDGWAWDPVGLAAQLETNIFTPAREAENMVKVMASLTRLYGELLQPLSTPEPYFALTSNLPRVSNLHSASALPRCELGSTSALEITLSNDAVTFWQPALLSCPTWVKTSPHPVWNPADGKVDSLAALFTAWGNSDNTPYQVPRDSAGGFAGDDISLALEYGDAVLATMTDRPKAEFPGVPVSGTTYIEIMNEDPGRESKSGSCDNARNVGVTMAIAGVVALLA